jgi:hypothetical protein
MMFKAETSTLEEYFAADPGGDADLRAVRMLCRTLRGLVCAWPSAESGHSGNARR